MSRKWRLILATLSLLLVVVLLVVASYSNPTNKTILSFVATPFLLASFYIYRQILFGRDLK